MHLDFTVDHTHEQSKRAIQTNRSREPRHIPEEIVRYYLMLLEHVKKQSNNEQKYVNISVQEGSVGKKFIESVTEYLNKEHERKHTTQTKPVPTTDTTADSKTATKEPFTTYSRTSTTTKRRIIIAMKAPPPSKQQTLRTTTKATVTENNFKSTQTETTARTSTSTSSMILIEDLQIEEITKSEANYNSKTILTKSAKPITSTKPVFMETFKSRTSSTTVLTFSPSKITSEQEHSKSVVPSKSPDAERAVETNMKSADHVIPSRSVTMKTFKSIYESSSSSLKTDLTIKSNSNSRTVESMTTERTPTPLNLSRTPTPNANYSIAHATTPRLSSNRTETIHPNNEFLTSITTSSNEQIKPTFLKSNSNNPVQSKLRPGNTPPFVIPKPTPSISPVSISTQDREMTDSIRLTESWNRKTLASSSFRTNQSSSASYSYVMQSEYLSAHPPQITPIQYTRINSSSLQQHSSHKKLPTSRRLTTESELTLVTSSSTTAAISSEINSSISSTRQTKSITSILLNTSRLHHTTTQNQLDSSALTSSTIHSFPAQSVNATHVPSITNSSLHTVIATSLHFFKLPLSSTTTPIMILPSQSLNKIQHSVLTDSNRNLTQSKTWTTWTPNYAPSVSLVEIHSNQSTKSNDYSPQTIHNTVTSKQGAIHPSQYYRVTNASIIQVAQPSQSNHANSKITHMSSESDYYNTTNYTSSQSSQTSHFNPATSTPLLRSSRSVYSNVTNASIYHLSDVNFIVTPTRYVPRSAFKTLVKSQVDNKGVVSSHIFHQKQTPHHKSINIKSSKTVLTANSNQTSTIKLSINEIDSYFSSQSSIYNNTTNKTIVHTSSQSPYHKISPTSKRLQLHSTQTVFKNLITTTTKAIRPLQNSEAIHEESVTFTTTTFIKSLGRVTNKINSVPPNETFYGQNSKSDSVISASNVFSTVLGTSTSSHVNHEQPISPSTSYLPLITSSLLPQTIKPTNVTSYNWVDFRKLLEDVNQREQLIQFIKDVVFNITREAENKVSKVGIHPDVYKTFKLVKHPEYSH